MTDPVGVAFIGYGRQAEFHARAMAATPDKFRLVAVSDITESRRAAAMSIGMRAGSQVSDALGADIELVFITSHSSLHFEHTIAAIKAGKHVMVEKPFATTGADARAMVDAARDAGVLISCFHNRRWDEDVCKVRTAVRDGLLGALVSIENRSAGARPAVGFGTPDFKQEWRITANMGGGTIFDFGPHWFDQVLSLKPGHRVVQVYGDVRHLRWGDADDFFEARIVFDDGCRATVGKCDFAYLSPPKWLIYGTAATLRHDNDTCIVETATTSLRVKEGDAKGDLFGNLHEAVRNGSPLLVTGNEACRNIELIEATITSARERRAIDVDI
ncbi:MAG: Gfo/Idh/MocA family oxidoreductase [Chloroflexi bacterium]|nr:Gfo/Idh/MocA family oxidoreductase [Chloroflexota bacterium]